MNPRRCHKKRVRTLSEISFNTCNAQQETHSGLGAWWCQGKIKGSLVSMTVFAFISLLCVYVLKCIIKERGEKQYTSADKREGSSYSQCSTSSSPSTVGCEFSTQWPAPHFSAKHHQHYRTLIQCYLINDWVMTQGEMSDIRGCCWRPPAAVGWSLPAGQTHSGSSSTPAPPEGEEREPRDIYF